MRHGDLYKLWAKYLLLLHICAVHHQTQQERKYEGVGGKAESLQGVLRRFRHQYCQENELVDDRQERQPEHVLEDRKTSVVLTMHYSTW